ncbi:MAG: phosphodiesterase [Pseudomonadota bacterium]
MKLIHLTDTHFVGPGLSLYGVNPRERLDAAISDINRNHSDADLVVITGDLTHWGEATAYRNLVECLSSLVPPVVPILGNHDNREIYREHFPDAPVDNDGFIQGMREIGRSSLLFLDTNQPGTHAGWYCEKRLAWLDAQLGAADREIFMFMHHPPFRTGLKSLDRIGLTQAADFRDVIEPHAHKIAHLFYGHVHRPICGSWLGIPTSTIRGTNHQVAFNLSPKESDIPFTYEEPAYAVVLIDRDSVVIHTHDYLYQGGTYVSGVYQSREEEMEYALNFSPLAAQ